MRTQPDDRRKDEILDAARQCFVDRGFASTRMDDVAAAAGLSKGGLYFHFSSKNALIQAVVSRENQGLAQLMVAAQPAGGHVRPQVSRILRLLLAYVRAHSDAARLSQCVMEEAPRNPAMAELVRTGDTLFLEYLERMVAGGQASGEVPASLSPPLAARWLMIVLEGAKSKFLLYPDWPWDDLVSELERALGLVLFANAQEGPCDPGQTERLVRS